MYSKMIDQMITREIIKAEDSDLYMFGLQNGVLLIINLITMFAIGFYFNRLAEIAIFLAAYAPLRHYCGGYHARTAMRCYFISIMVILLIILALNNITWSSGLCFFAVLASAIIIILLAPVADENKPLDADETKVFTRIARTILVVELLIFAAVHLFEFTYFYSSMSLSFIAIAGMLVLGAVKWKHDRKTLNN